MIASSRKAVQAAINFQSAFTEIQKLTGLKSAAQCAAHVDKLLKTIAPMASLAPAKPLLASSPEARPVVYSNLGAPILSDIAAVLGRQTLTPEQIVVELLSRGKLQKGKRAVRYTSDLLSRNSNGKGTNRFTRVRRGHYKVRNDKKLEFRQKNG